MRAPAFATIASFVLLAAPALAQTSNMTGGQPGDTSTSSHVPPDTAVTLDTQQKLKQSLEQNRVNATYSWDASPISTARMSAELWAQLKN